MKNFLNKKNIHYFLMFCSVAFCIILASCSNDNMGTPVITGVRNYVASPNDTIIDSAVAKEQYVVIEGQNLGSALRISFNGVPATFNYSFLTPNHAVVKIPAIVFSQIDVNKLYTIEYVTSEGSTTFSFKLGPEAPVITAISDVFTEPADSIFIYGTNLVLIKKLSYGGTAITSFKPNVSGTSVGFVMPAPAPTSGNVEIDAYGGMAIFKIAADPIIFSISNENAAVNDSVFVYGQYLKGVESFSFGGTTISSYKLNNNGSSIGFVLPSSPQKGPVAITTSFGSVTTFYDVNDIYGTSSLSICDGGDNWQFWAADLYSGDPSSGWPSYTPDFPGTKSQFLVIDQGTLLAGAGQPWDRAIRLDSKNWVAQANINDPVENYALKFEMSIPNAWNGSSMLIQTDNDTYTYRWEPWKISANISKAYSTKGWITVTVPFTEFRAKDAALGVGRGNSMTELISLLGTSGKSGFYLYAHNYSTSATATGFKAAFDNIRVVKVK